MILRNNESQKFKVFSNLNKVRKFNKIKAKKLKDEHIAVMADISEN